jgi:hypothetical protein
VHAQEQGTVQLLVQPWHRVQLILDGKERISQVSELKLSGGMHNLRFWSPGFMMWDTSLTVEPGQVIMLRKVLVHSPEHKRYQDEHSAMARKKAFWKYVPSAATLCLGIFALKAKSSHDAAYEHLHELEADYAFNNVPSAIRVLKQTEIPEAQIELDRTRKVMVTRIALCGAAAAATVYGFIHAHRLKYPDYEDREKTRFEGIVWVPGSEGGTWYAGITLPIR